MMVLRHKLYWLGGLAVLVILVFILAGLISQQLSSASSEPAADASSAAIVEIIYEDGEFKQEPIDDFARFLAETDRPVFVDFWAAWCPPCRAASPFVDSLARTFHEQAHIVKVNVDDARDVAFQYDVQSIPYFVVILNGATVDSALGYHESMQSDLTDMISRHTTP